MVEIISAVEDGLLASDDGVRITAPCGLGTSVPDCSHGLVAIRIDVDAILARRLNRECQIWRIHLKKITVIEGTYADEECAERQSQLAVMIVQIEEGQTRFGVHAHRSGSDVQFC